MVAALDPARLICRDTASKPGRRIYLSPKNSPLKHITYGRIILKNGMKPVVLRSKTHETGLICMSGNARILLDGRAHAVGMYDAVYLARGSRCEIRAAGRVDLIETSAQARRATKSAFIPFAKVKEDPKLAIDRPQTPSARSIFIQAGDNVDADRLVFGVTFSRPGNWTSWPPHEHAKTREEIYVYFGMPKPAYGIQLVYDDPKKIHALAVRDGDVAIIPRGYHPNVACPTTTINFCWIMAANRPVKDRGWGEVNIEPGFETQKSR